MPVAKVLCPRHGGEFCVRVCIHVAEAFHQGATKPLMRRVGVPFIGDSPWSIRLCPACLSREGLPDNDQIWPGGTDEEFEASMGRLADIDERVGRFICAKCWREAWG